MEVLTHTSVSRNNPFEGIILLKSLLRETYTRVAVVVGVVRTNRSIESEESFRSHSECDFRCGKCWRYNPYNKTLYWHGDSSEHNDNDELAVENHLDKKYGYSVKRRITLEELDPEVSMSAFNKSHGYMG